MKKILPSVLIVFGAMTACSVQESINIIERGSSEIEFTATHGEAETKSILIQDGLFPDGQPKMTTWWSPKEEICIFHGASGGSKFTSTNTERVQKAIFRGEIEAGENENGDSNFYWAVYPYDAAVSCDGESVVAILADEQEAFAGSYANKTNITIAKSSGLSLGFYNVCSFFRFTVEKEGVIAATFRGNNNEYVAGKFCVSIGVDGKPTRPIIIDGEKEITLTRPNNEPFVVGESYFFTILPQTFENGFTVQFETANKVGNRIISVSAPFTRNSINYGISAFDNGVTYTSNSLPPENELWYTTSDESKLVINENLGWHRSISPLVLNHVIYHKYKRGKGIVRFDGPVNHIPQNAFKGYEKMTSVTLPSNVETIQSYAFSGTCISSFELPHNLTFIGSCAFEDVQTMTWVSINSNVQEVGVYAFRNSGITQAQVSAQELEDYVFYGSKLKTLSIGSTCSEIGMGIVAGCTDLETITVAFNNTTFTSKNDSRSSEMNCIMRTSDNLVLAGCKNTFFNILNTYTRYSINAEAFMNVGLSNLVNLQANSVTIGTSAFARNNIQTLRIGNSNSTVSIEGGAFIGNTNLQSVYFNSTKLPTVGYDIFGSGNSFTIYVPASKLNEYKTTQNLTKYASLMVGN